MLNDYYFKKIQLYFRKKRFKHINELLETTLKKKERISILDIGGRPEYWNQLDKEIIPKVTITILNTESELNRYSNNHKKLNIVLKKGNGCHMPEFSNNEFDLSHSNSVIEHVGSYKNMLSFTKESQRVGKYHYLQTPNFWFPIEPHTRTLFFHWLPDVLQIWLYTKRDIGCRKKCSLSEALLRVDTTKMISQSVIRRLLPSHTITKERVFFLTKSYICKK